MNNIEQTRLNMVEQQIRTWNVFDQDILNIYSTLKRENFVPGAYKDIALSEVEIPLPGIQKMLLPRVEARMLQALELNKRDKVLELGTGSGYVTAALAKLTGFIYSIEIDNTNSQLALANLTESGITNVGVIAGNGINGMPAKAPYDKIFVGGALQTIPDCLKKQLKVGGKLVGFFGYTPIMQAIVITKISEAEFSQKQLFETDIEYLVGAQSQQFNF